MSGHVGEGVGAVVEEHADHRALGVAAGEDGDLVLLDALPAEREEMAVDRLHELGPHAVGAARCTESRRWPQPMCAGTHDVLEHEGAHRLRRRPEEAPPLQRLEDVGEGLVEPRSSRIARMSALEACTSVWR
jgi:hypothetical protein